MQRIPEKCGQSIGAGGALSSETRSIRDEWRILGKALQHRQVRLQEPQLPHFIRCQPAVLKRIFFSLLALRTPPHEKRQAYAPSREVYDFNPELL